MKRSRRNHTSKFKARIALEALRGDATLVELASRHGVHATQIATWRKQLLEHAGEVFDNGNPAAEDAQRHIRDLRAKVGELTMERDFLSGALGRFGLLSAKR
jgi:transposase-like protein